MKQKKMIFVTGGVLSSLGKGISAASLGMLMEQRGISVTMIKMDPYLNLDPGTMNPSQHGEVFVLDDGSETDLDLGHYSRFVKNACFTKKNSFTTGKIYDLVLRKERAGEYLGETIQVIPHITDEIKKHIREAASDADLAIIEVGGTVGDIESLPFLEAIRQMRVEEGEGNVLFIHLTLVPYVATAGELKTKPTQHSVKELRGIGIQPDILLCRCDRTLPKEAREKIGLFCNVSGSQVFTAMDVSSIYEVPLAFHEEGLDEKVSEKLGIWSGTPDLSEWKQMVMKLRSPRNKVSIGIIGKYTDWRDSYKSLSEALVHGGVCHDASVQVEYVDAERLDADSVAEFLKSVQGILVPGGFGERGAEGKIVAIEYARNHKIPFFGICLGMQLLASRGEEGGNFTGLDLIPGDVIRLNKIGCQLKIPHVGWNSVQFGHEDMILKDIPNEADFYFVHSFYAKPSDWRHSAGQADYGGRFTAAVARDNLFATQFHPEKSAQHGLRLYRNFLNWQP